MYVFFFEAAEIFLLIFVHLTTIFENIYICQVCFGILPKYLLVYFFEKFLSYSFSYLISSVFSKYLIIINLEFSCSKK